MEIFFFILFLFLKVDCKSKKRENTCSYQLKDCGNPSCCAMSVARKYEVLMEEEDSFFKNETNSTKISINELRESFGKAQWLPHGADMVRIGPSNQEIHKTNYVEGNVFSPGLKNSGVSSIAQYSFIVYEIPEGVKVNYYWLIKYHLSSTVQPSNFRVGVFHTILPGDAVRNNQNIELGTHNNSWCYVFSSHEPIFSYHDGKESTEQFLKLRANVNAATEYNYIGMYLNTYKGELSFVVNGIETGVVWRNDLFVGPKINLNPAVSIESDTEYAVKMC